MLKRVKLEEGRWGKKALHANNGKVGGEAEEGRKISMLKRRRVKEKERQRKEESSAW